MAAGRLDESRRAETGHEAGLRVAGVPVFLYHGLLRGDEGAPSGSDPRYWLSASTFRTQLAMLRGEGAHVSLLDDLRPTRPAGQSGNGHRGRAAILTFDDGRLCDYEVTFPLLAEAEARAEFFMNTSTIGTPGYLTWPQMRAMQSAGMAFQSHSHDHVILVGLPAATLGQQLSDSRRRLEDGLGVPVRYLGAPYGLVDRRVVRAALEAGYRAVCTSGEWMARPGARTISRLTLYASTSLQEFHQLFRGTAALLTRRRLRVGLAYVPKLILLRLRRRSLERTV